MSRVKQHVFTLKSSPHILPGPEFLLLGGIIECLMSFYKVGLSFSHQKVSFQCSGTKGKKKRIKEKSKKASGSFHFTYFKHTEPLMLPYIYLSRSFNAVLLIIVEYLYLLI